MELETNSTVRSYIEDAITEIDHGFPESARIDLLGALGALDASQPQCLDNPPNCSHRLVPDPT